MFSLMMSYTLHHIILFTADVILMLDFIVQNIEIVLETNVRLVNFAFALSDLVVSFLSLLVAFFVPRAARFTARLGFTQLAVI